MPLSLIHISPGGKTHVLHQFLLPAFVSWRAADFVGRDFVKLIHGGDVEGFREEFGREPLDFSANISPLGLPEGVRQGVIDSLSQATQYPDPLCRKLRRAIGEKEGIDPEYIQCGNGAADLRCV